MITPLRRLFMAPEVMMTNRVVRKYGEEHALRCVFRDDNGNKIQVKDFASGFSSDRDLFVYYMSKRLVSEQSAIITAMVHQTLTHGVEISNRNYHFLAWSNSQVLIFNIYGMKISLDERSWLLYVCTNSES